MNIHLHRLFLRRGCRLYGRRSSFWRRDVSGRTLLGTLLERGGDDLVQELIRHMTRKAGPHLFGVKAGNYSLVGC